MWRRTLAVAVPQQIKLVEDRSYRTISLLCVPYKILERLIYARVEPIIDPLLPKRQDGIQRGKLAVDQVVENSFQAKTDVVFVALTAAYYTV